MKKRQLFLVFVLLLLIAVGVGGTLAARTLLAKPTSLYLTGTEVIPTIPVSTSTANCNIPTPGSASTSAEGNMPPAIKPHLCTIPTFTEQDVRHYMSTISRFGSREIEQVSPHFTVTRILFVTNKVANSMLNADTGVADDSRIVCYVEVYGDFAVISSVTGKESKSPILHYGQMVFDGITGNLLVIGVVP